jgi:hypothetical protein
LADVSSLRAWSGCDYFIGVFQAASISGSTCEAHRPLSMLTFIAIQALWVIMAKMYKKSYNMIGETIENIGWLEISNAS